MTPEIIEGLYAQRAVLQRYATRYVGPEEAEDVVSDAFLGLMTSKYEEQGKGLNYMYRTVRNTALNRIRDRRYDRDIEKCNPSYEQDSSKESLRLRVQRALNVLTPEERGLVELQLDGRNIYEWADSRGINYADIGRARVSGFAKLRKELG